MAEPSTITVVLLFPSTIIYVQEKPSHVTEAYEENALLKTEGILTSSFKPKPRETYTL